MSALDFPHPPQNPSDGRKGQRRGRHARASWAQGAPPLAGAACQASRPRGSRCGLWVLRAWVGPQLHHQSLPQFPLGQTATSTVPTLRDLIHVATPAALLDKVAACPAPSAFPVILGSDASNTGYRCHQPYFGDGRGAVPSSRWLSWPAAAGGPVTPLFLGNRGLGKCTPLH